MWLIALVGAASGVWQDFAPSKVWLISIFTIRLNFVRTFQISVRFYGPNPLPLLEYQRLHAAISPMHPYIVAKLLIQIHWIDEHLGFFAFCSNYEKDIRLPGPSFVGRSQYWPFTSSCKVQVYSNQLNKNHSCPPYSFTTITMQLSYIISGLSTMLAVTYAAPSPLVTRSADFIGTGQIIAEHDTDGTILGCLTVDGLLTADTTLCGTFTGTYASSTSVSILITSSAGDCGVYGNSAHEVVEFTCGENAPSGGSSFSVSFIIFSCAKCGVSLSYD